MSPHKKSAWDAALKIMETLRAHGHQALLAGGCVRDRLLDRSPKDYDVATDAVPQRVKEIFPRARQVGAKFGVMLVRAYGIELEVATFRSDGTYSDGRHPDDVSFGTQEDDARRRDFTINGLFYDPFEDRVIDHVRGRADIEAGIIRTIGDPARRFAEDHLRMLRAVRFAARLGFEIESHTLQALKEFAAELRGISAERVWMELELILADEGRVRGWKLLVQTGLREHLSPRWPVNTAHDPRITARLAALPNRPVNATLGLVSVVTDEEPARVARVCRSLRLSNQDTHSVVWMARSLPAIYDEHALELADLKTLMNNAAWSDLLMLFAGDLVAGGHPTTAHKRLEERAASIRPEDIAPPPLVNGDDLSAMGVSPGPRMGEILTAVYRAQLNERILSREQAMDLARALLKA